MNKRPHLTLLVTQSREEAERQAALRRFIKACEALYEKNKQSIDGRTHHDEAKKENRQPPA